MGSVSFVIWWWRLGRRLFEILEIRESWGMIGPHRSFEGMKAMLEG